MGCTFIAKVYLSCPEWGVNTRLSATGSPPASATPNPTRAASSDSGRGAVALASGQAQQAAEAGRRAASREYALPGNPAVPNRRFLGGSYVPRALVAEDDHLCLR